MKPVKRIVITGASSGIGLALAEAFASRGVRVGVAARNLKALHEFKNRYPDLVECEMIDVNISDAPHKLELLVKKLGGMDLYIHTAGIGYDNPTQDIERETSIVRTNTVGFTRLIFSAYKIMKEQKLGGQIVGISSVAGTKGIGEMTAYSASKRFESTYLEAMDQLSSIEGADIIFTDIRPGWTRTPLLKEDKRYLFEMTQEEMVAGIIRAIVNHRRIAIIDWRWNLLTGLWRLIPSAIWRRIPLTFTGELTQSSTKKSNPEI